MLSEIHIQNYVLIDRITIHFGNGFNVLSGETGAGKSILLGALSLILGAKAGSEVIRVGSAECVISALCAIADDSPTRAWLQQRGIATENNHIIIRRVIRESGRGAAYIQSVPITLNELAACTVLLIDVHGQHKHQSLLRSATHRLLLDRYSGSSELAHALFTEHTHVSKLQKRYHTLNSYQREHKHELELLHHAVTEIESAQLVAHEEQELEQKTRILSQSEKLRNLYQELYDFLATRDNGVAHLLQKARITMEQISKIDTAMVKQSERLDTAYFELEDLAQHVQDEMRSTQYDPHALREHQDRLNTILTLQAKYGNTIEKVAEYAHEAKAQIAELESWEENKRTMEQEIASRQQNLMQIAKQLSEIRIQYAAELERKITPILVELGINNAHFEIAVDQQKSESGNLLCGPTGIDLVEYLMRTNVGEPMRPLSKIASGGEISRVMLALKSVFAESDRISTMIFDEIDSGIGGEVALAVGKYIQRLAAHKQIICITHIASIAARADHHLCVEKIARGERTLTTVRKLVDEDRIREVARMLAGDVTTAPSLAHARQLIANTSKYEEQE